MKLVHAIGAKTMCLAFLFIILIGCSKNEDKYIVSVDQKELLFSSGTGEEEFKITSSDEWHIEADGLDFIYGKNSGSTDWYTISPISGKGDATVVIILMKVDLVSEKSSILKVRGKNNTEIVRLKYSVENKYISEN